MIEIVILIVLYKRLAEVAERKGRARSWGWLPVGLWIFGELLGVGLATAMRGGNGTMYLMGLGFAGVGAAIGGYVVSRLEGRVPVDTEAFD
ncbi:MAG: hypothetical protein KC635_28835 [Myxococcales bacterium]|nr:hypothetical protein [Myxococcales bacterium]MCB9734882.1 hypothetical protein [Deltaproteobacteria bacterium]